MSIEKLKKGIWGGSIILMLTINAYFALNYFFHFAMARLLSVAEYGIVVTLYSFIYMSSIFTESIQVVVSKYSTQEDNLGKLKNVLRKTFRKAVGFSFWISFFFMVVGVFLSKILKIEYGLMALTGIVIFAMFFSPITRGVMQGRKKFGALGFNMIIESASKFIVSIALVLVGWAVYGAIAATLIALVIALLSSFGSLKDIFLSKEYESSTPGIYKYTAPVFIVIVAVISFYSIDVIIAKIFFEPEVAGLYAIASTLSKIIFFGTQPISRAMFPLVSETKDKKDSGKILITSIGILIFCIAVALITIYFIPNWLVKIFSGRFIPEIEPILIFPAIAVSFISLANLILLYKLSRGAIQNYYYLLIFAVIEIVLMSIFHNSLLEFSVAYLTASSIFLWGTIFLIKNKEA